MRLTKVHRLIELADNSWMVPYVSMNSWILAADRNDTKNDFPRLMNKALYGKTCENQKKRTDIHLVNDRLQEA